MIVGCPASGVIWRQQLHQRTSVPELLARFKPNLAGMIRLWPSLIIILMVLVRGISRPHRLKINFQDENFKIFLSENTLPRALIFGMLHQLVDFYQVCSNYVPGEKWACRGVTCFT